MTWFERDEPSPVGSFAFCAITGLALFALMVANGRYEGSSCPADAFAIKVPRDPAAIMSMLFEMASVSWFVGLVLDGAFLHAPSRRGSLIFAASIGGLLLATLLLANHANRYSCATRSGIFVRDGLTDVPRGFSWDDVRTVEAYCREYTGKTGRRSSWSGLILTSGSGSEAAFEFPGMIGRRSASDPSGARTVETFRAFLAGKEFSYALAASVTRDMCPVGVHPLLVRFKE